MSDDGRPEQILVVLILILAVLAGIFVASLGSRCTSTIYTSGGGYTATRTVEEMHRREVIGRASCRERVFGYV